MKPQVVKYLLIAQNMDRAVSFYRDVLGFTEDFVSSHSSELRFGDAILALRGGGDGSRRATGLSIQYEDVQLAYVAAIESGAEPIHAPEHKDDEPIMISVIADTEGNVITLTQTTG
jgi:predicted enzyme related to lactoylglutathione lyase